MGLVVGIGSDLDSIRTRSSYRLCHWSTSTPIPKGKEAMSKDAQKELLDWLDGEIKSCERRLESSINMGWDDKASVCGALLRKFKPLRRLVEAFYGDWKPIASGLCASDTWDEYPEKAKIENIIEDIGGFDPMAAEDKEKVKEEEG